MTQPRPLILGASSLVGRFLTPMAEAAGLKPLALSRDPPPASDPGGWIRGDLRDLSFASGLAPLSTVFSLSPIWLLPQALSPLIDQGADRVVAFSSTSRFTKKTSPVASERAVAETIARSEDAVIAGCEARGIGWTLLRPTMIYAEGADGNVTRLAALIRRLGVIPLAGRGEGLRQPVHAEDLAAAALSVAPLSATINQAYDLPGGETLTYGAMVERIFEALDRPPRIVRVPPALWSLALRLAGPLLPGATVGMGVRMSEDLVFDPSAAKRDLAWRPRPFRPQFQVS